MNREKASYLEGTLSIIVNILLFGLKLWAGIISSSIALIADAWHTLSDSLSSIIVVISTKLSSKKPDQQHPFGHGRWEHIASLFIAFMLGIIAFDFVKDAISQLNKRESANFGTVAIVVTVISIIAKELLAQFAFFLGKKWDNSTVKADGWHHRTDAISSVIILVGIAFRNFLWWMDSILGIAVSALLFYAAFVIAKEATFKLMGERPNDELIKKIESEISNITQLNLQPHHYHIHNYVTHQELTFHVQLNKTLPVSEGHALVTKIEEKLFEQLGIYSTIHLEPLNFAHRFD